MDEKEHLVTACLAVKGDSIDCEVFVYKDGRGQSRAVGRLAGPCGTIRYFEPRVPPGADLEAQVAEAMAGTARANGCRMTRIDLGAGVSPDALLEAMRG